MRDAWMKQGRRVTENSKDEFGGDKKILIENITRARNELARCKLKIQNLEQELASSKLEARRVRQTCKRGKSALLITDKVPRQFDLDTPNASSFQVLNSAYVLSVASSPSQCATPDTAT